MLCTADPLCLDGHAAGRDPQPVTFVIAEGRHYGLSLCDVEAHLKGCAVAGAQHGVELGQTICKAGIRTGAGPQSGRCKHLSGKLHAPWPGHKREIDLHIAPRIFLL